MRNELTLDQINAIQTEALSERDERCPECMGSGNQHNPIHVRHEEGGGGYNRECSRAQTAPAVRTGIIMWMNGTATPITVGAANLADHIASILGENPRVQRYADGKTMYTERIHDLGGYTAIPEEGVPQHHWRLIPNRENVIARDYNHKRIPENGALGCTICGNAILIDK